MNVILNFWSYERLGRLVDYVTVSIMHSEVAWQHVLVVCVRVKNTTLQQNGQILVT